MTLHGFFFLNSSATIYQGRTTVKVPELIILSGLLKH